jgi:CHASE2 domain-containing sensor protein
MASTPREAPYPGLSPFGEEDAERFFGRRAERDLAVANLLTSRLTVLYGPSGVGKSSLLRAGVLPRLQTGDGLPARGSPRAIALVDAWQGDPVEAIVHALDGTGPPSGDVALDDALAAYGERIGGYVLLVLDQFEEYFLYHRDGDRLRAELPRALARADVHARVLISLREDALAGLDRLEGSTAPLFGNLLRLGPLSSDAARAAITRPLEGSAIAAEDGLPERVLERLAGEDGGVEPVYLQLVMRRLWDRETAAGSSLLRVATLDAMGSLRDVVGEQLDEAMERLTAPEQRTMAAAFRFMVTPSGGKIAQRRDDLAQLTGTDEATVGAPLEKLAARDARILRAVDEVPSYEIFHDVLAQPVLDWRAGFEARRLQRRAVALGMLAAAGAAIVLALIAFILAPGWLQRLELATVDARFAVRGTAAPDRDIVIVDLDPASLAALGGVGGRIPRALHARMIDNLRAAGAAVIAYDFEFREQTAADTELRAAIERAGPQLLLAAARIDSEGRGEVLGSAGDELSASIGYAGFPVARDGAYRQVDEAVGLSGAERLELLARRLPSFAVVAASLAGDPAPHFERAWIDFRGPAGTFPSYRFADVLRRADPRRFEGRIVVVGASAMRARDIHRVARNRTMPGAEIQANAISTLRRGIPLRALPTGAGLALIVVAGLLPALLAIAVRPWRAALVTALAAVVYVVAVQALFAAGRIVPVVVPLLALVLSAAGVFAVRAVLARRAGSARA